MCLIINHFVTVTIMYYGNPQVNYMVTVFIRLVIAVVQALHLLSCSKSVNVLFACVFSNTDTVSWLVGVQIKVML